MEVFFDDKKKTPTHIQEFQLSDTVYASIVVLFFCSVCKRMRTMRKEKKAMQTTKSDFIRRLLRWEKRKMHCWHEISVLVPTERGFFSSAKWKKKKMMETTKQLNISTKFIWIRYRIYRVNSITKIHSDKVRRGWNISNALHTDLSMASNIANDN